LINKEHHIQTQVFQGLFIQINFYIILIPVVDKIIGIIPIGPILQNTVEVFFFIFNDGLNHFKIFVGLISLRCVNIAIKDPIKDPIGDPQKHRSTTKGDNNCFIFQFHLAPSLFFNEYQLSIYRSIYRII
jgi:hypothetical protein